MTKQGQIEGRLFIGGEFRPAADGSTMADINPVSEEPIAAVSVAGPDDIDAAVAAAAGAHKEWVQLNPSDRSAILMAVAQAVEDAGDELASLDSLDAGKPLGDCLEDVHAAALNFRYFAGLADKLEGVALPVQNENLCYVVREPYGVVAAITAWNYPLFNASAKVAPILATGNACVLKPAEESPLTALRLADVIEGVEGVPAGLVNVVNGPGETTGSYLAHHTEVPKLTFTGSTETGRKILAASAESNLKSVTLELGGKSPFVLFPDGNLEAALNALTFSVFYNQGQTCTAATRLIVHESIVDEVIEGLRMRAARVIVGDPADPSVSVGPIISREQYDKVEGFVTAAVDGGASVVFGATRPEGLDRGFFYAPTLLADLEPESPSSQEEIFGPVLVMHPFGTEEEAMQLANGTKYGLASSIWTQDATRLHRLSRQIHAGVVWCNTVFAEHPGAPVGGYAASGLGREFGRAAIEEYTRGKTIWVGLSGEFFDWPE